MRRLSISIVATPSRQFSLVESSLLSQDCCTSDTTIGKQAEYLTELASRELLERKLHQVVLAARQRWENQNVPDFPEQQKIVDCISSLDATISVLKKQLNAFNYPKQGLMQKLFTGQVRVKLDELSSLDVSR